MVVRASGHSQVEPVAGAAVAPITIHRRRRALLGGLLLAIAALAIAVPLQGVLLDTSAAVPNLSIPGRALGPLLVPGEPPGSEQRAQEDPQASLDPLNQVLDETRAMLEDLIAAKAADTVLRNELRALKRDNERLAVELAQANTRRIELERSSELAEARIAELTEAVDTGRREAARTEEELTRLCWQEGQLNQSLARADATRKAALAEAEKARGEMAKELEAARNAAAQSEADLAGLHKELEAKDQELAAANTAREEVGARVSQLEETVAKSSAADLERLKTELAAVKEELGQAAGAAIEAERARQLASNEAERLRSEAARARDESRAVSTENARLKTANAELEKKLFSWRMSWIKARQKPIRMEENVEEVNAALDLAPLEEATPVASGSTKSAAPETLLLLPVTEPLHGRSATRRDHPEITIAAAPGQGVAAPVDGTIVFADRFKSYGLLLIIEHERGYHTLLWGFAALEVSLGDYVQAGQVVGIMGARGADPPVLHVQRRRNGRPINLAARSNGIQG
jgi:murein hydrolase activator